MAPKVTEVAAAIICRHGKYLIARRGPGSHAAEKWEFPGGKIEGGEGAAACLRRELEEELGIRVEVGSPFLTSSHDYGEQGIVRLHSYLCWLVDGEPQPRVHTDLQWAAPEELSVYDFAPADIAIMERLRSDASVA